MIPKKKRIITFVLACFLLTSCGIMNRNTSPSSKVSSHLSDNSSHTSAESTPSNSVIAISQSEYQNFYHNYLNRWTLYNPFIRSYTEETFAYDYSSYLLYAGSVLQESNWMDFAGPFLDAGDIPTDYVEQVITRHFPVTAEQYRASLPMSSDANEYYHAAQNIYHFPGGYGGAEKDGKVVEVLQQGNCYYVSCDWNDADGNYLFSHTVTIEIGETDLDFYYKENTLTAWASDAMNPEISSVLQKVLGYWTSDELNGLVGLELNELGFTFTYALWETDSGRGPGVIETGTKISDTVYGLSTYFEPVPESELSAALPEETIYVELDISSLQANQTINVKVPHHGNSGYYTYTYLALTFQDAVAAWYNGS